MEKIIHRGMATQLSLTLYYTGKLCKNGHLAKRRTSNGNCLMCEPIHYGKSYKKHVESHKIRMHTYYKNNAEHINETNRSWYEAHPDAIKKYNDRGYAKDKSRYILQGNKRRMNIKQATPLWFEREAIAALYVECDRISLDTGTPHHVDHIVPIKQELVCGLNCLANLQILTAVQNLKKKNYWITQ
jgi:5-methylcytosine-specific restriction endonuclease McrA